ncbi:MAG: PTS sugar transporter subunit IIA [Puniceicoccales bacterium]|nr:PTS sugar transporter subunit IIA [Puniceicoccales bacterium]
MFLPFLFWFIEHPFFAAMLHVLDAIQNNRLFALRGTGKVDALTLLAGSLGNAPAVDTVEEILRREEELNTGIGLGMAVPHLRDEDGAGGIHCAIGWSAPGIDYEALDGQPVHLVVMYCIPGAQKNAYLKEISGLIKALRKNGGIAPVANAPGLDAVRGILQVWAEEPGS